MFQKIIFVLVFSCMFYPVQAQKKPSSQTNSIHMPPTVKIDGKAEEFNDKLEAYSNNTNFYYTISNDNHRLYLTIKITDPVIINKVISAGVSFIVYNTTSNKESQGLKITYPIYDINDRPQVDVKNAPKFIDSQPVTRTRADSFMFANNNRLLLKSKWIRTEGFAGLDTLTSVYNREGIRVAQRFDNKVNLTLEMAIDFKLLGFSITNTDSFNYAVESPAATMTNLNGVIRETNAPGAKYSMSLTILPSAMPPSTLSLMMSTTNFKGIYKLAK